MWQQNSLNPLEPQFSRYDWWIIRTLQVYALTTPVLYFRQGDLTIGIADILWPIAFLLIGLGKVSNFPRIFLVYIAFTGIAILSTLLSPFAGIDNSLKAFRLLTLAIPFCLVFAIEAFSLEAARRILISALIGSGIAVVAGLLVFAFGIDLGHTETRLWQGRSGGLAHLRAGGIAGHPNSFGHMTALFAGLLLTLVFLSRIFPMDSILKRLAYCAGWAAVAIALYVSSSRSGLAMVAVLMGVIYFHTSLRNRLFFVISCIVVTAILTIIVIMGTESYNDFSYASIRRLDVLNLTGQSRFFDSIRFQNWAYLLDEFAGLPMFGYGYRTLRENLGIFLDNSYLIALFETGIFGLLLLVGFWGYLFVVGLGYVWRGSNLAVLAFAFIAAFVVRMGTGGANASWSAAPLSFLLIAVFWRSALLELSVMEWRRRPVHE